MDGKFGRIIKKMRNLHKTLDKVDIIYYNNVNVTSNEVFIMEGNAMRMYNSTLTNY